MHLQAAAAHPYAEWLSASKPLSHFSDAAFLSEPSMDAAEALKRQAAAGFGLEDTQMVVEGMAQV